MITCVNNPEHNPFLSFPKIIFPLSHFWVSISYLGFLLREKTLIELTGRDQLDFLRFREGDHGLPNEKGSFKNFPLKPPTFRPN
jgi:hypothetical protein